MTTVDPYIASQIAKFWKWWAGASTRIHNEVAAEDYGRERRAIANRLAMLDRKLRWEIRPGTYAQHCLMLLPRQDPDRRHLVRLLLASAPPVDAIWEYAAGRPPNPVLETLEIGSVDGELLSIDVADLPDHPEELGVTIERVALADMRVVPSWDADFERAELRFWHPVFARMDPAEAFEIGQPAIAGLLGDEDELRWLGELRADPSIGSHEGIALSELRAWIDRQAATATGNRWITERRRDQRKRYVAVRFNAAQKPMDLPPGRSGIAVVLQRTVQDVEAPETKAALEPVADLVANLDPGTVRLLEVSEWKRLTVVFVSADIGADRRAVRAWERRWPKVDAEFEVKRRPKLTEQLELGELGRGRKVTWEAAPTMRTRGDGRLYRRARWIERHPRRLLVPPLLTAVAVILLGVAVPSYAHLAAALLIGVAGVIGALIATYMASSTYVTLRNSKALGLIAVLVDGWRIGVIMVFSLALIVIALDELFSR